MLLVCQRCCFLWYFCKHSFNVVNNSHEEEGEWGVVGSKKWILVKPWKRTNKKCKYLMTEPPEMVASKKGFCSAMRSSYFGLYSCKLSMLHYKMLVGLRNIRLFGCCCCCGHGCYFLMVCSCHFSQVVVVYGTGYGEKTWGKCLRRLKIERMFVVLYIINNVEIEDVCRNWEV